jgi:hypothetical protein
MSVRTSSIASGRDQTSVDAAKNEIAVESKKHVRTLKETPDLWLCHFLASLAQAGFSGFKRRSENVTFLTSSTVPTFLLVLSGEGLSPTGWPKLLNLALFVGLLYYLLRKPAREFFSNRLGSVRATLDRAAKDREAATAKLNSVNERWPYRSEIAEIRLRPQQRPMLNASDSAGR